MSNHLNLINQEYSKLNNDERLFLYKKIKNELTIDEILNDFISNLIYNEISENAILNQLLYLCESVVQEDLTKNIFEIWKNRKLLTQSQIDRISEFSKEPFI